MFFFDPTFVLLLPALALMLWAQYKVKSTYKKYSQVPSATGFTGAQVARRLLDEGGLSAVPIENISGKLSDHYDPRSKTLRLSQGTAQSHSVAALGVAAHEVGHALQHRDAYTAFQIRQSIFPAANLGSNLAFPLFFVGLLFSISMLQTLGIVFFAGALLFQLVTLPVEFNASSRALTLLTDRGILKQDETRQAKRVLDAAALTYVAATLMALLQMLRMILLSGSRD